MSVSVWKNIAFLRGVAICFVVLAHSAHANFNTIIGRYTYIPFSEIKSAFLLMVFAKTFSSFGIPAFLFASAFMLYRMYKNWKGVKKMSLELAKKYLIWAIPLYVLISIKQGNMDFLKIISGLIKGGPMAAYWYFILIIELLLMSPILIYLVRNHFKYAVFIMFFLQAMVFFRYYYHDPLVFNVVIDSLIIRPLKFFPPFIAGLIFSDRSKYWIPVLKKKRALFLVLTLFSACLCVVESFFRGYVDHWNVNDFQNMFSTERISLICFFVCGTIWVISREEKKTSLISWISNIGMASFSVFLMMDICMNSIRIAIYHLFVKCSFIPITGHYWYCIRLEGLPSFLFITLPIYFASGLLGPISIVKIIENRFGKKYRYLYQ